MKFITGYWTRARRAGLACGVVLIWALAGCATLLGPREVTISEAELQRIVAQRFPFNNRYLELLDIEVSSPRVKMLPETNRIATEMDVRTSERFLRTAFTGRLAMNYGLRFEPSDRTVRLTNVRVDDFRIDGAPGAVRSQVNRIGAFLAEELLKDQVIHTLKPEDLAAAQGRGYQPGELKVTSSGVSLQLVPLK
jgi:hypothetical protein